MAGKIIIEPEESVLAEYQKKKEDESKRKELLAALKGKPTATKSGKSIKLYANIGGIGDVGAALMNDAEGIGLFRSEFLYLQNDHYPTEEEQFSAYKSVAEMMGGRKVIIRTLDIGADKRITRRSATAQCASAWTARRFLRHSFARCTVRVRSATLPLWCR